MKQYIPIEKAKCGMEMFSVRKDSKYLWNSFIYLGKDGEPDTYNRMLKEKFEKSGAILVLLVLSLLYSGYTLFVDNR